MAVTDIKAAYRTVMVRPCDRMYQGLVWPIEGHNQFIQDNYLSFGTRVATYIFNAITNAVARYVTAHGYFCVNYLDNFLVMGSSYEDCKAAQLFLHKTLRALGFYISYNKVRSPSQIKLYLGVELDSLEMQLRLPEEKLNKLQIELQWSDFAEWFHGIAQIIQPPRHTSMVTTDASGTGYRAFCSIVCISGQWEQDMIVDLSGSVQYRTIQNTLAELYH